MPNGPDITENDLIDLLDGISDAPSQARPEEEAMHDWLEDVAHHPEHVYDSTVLIPLSDTGQS